jgi:hypothetical protein
MDWNVNIDCYNIEYSCGRVQYLEKCKRKGGGGKGNNERYEWMLRKHKKLITV